MMQRKLFLIWALIAAVILATTRAQDAEPEPEGEPAAEPEGKLGIISGGCLKGAHSARVTFLRVVIETEISGEIFLSVKNENEIALTKFER